MQMVFKHPCVKTSFCSSLRQGTCTGVRPCIGPMNMVSNQQLKVMQDEALARGEAKLLAQHIQAKFMQPIEQLLMPDYPLRCPPAAEAAEPAVSFKLDEVSVSLKVSCNTAAHKTRDACCQLNAL